MIVFGGKLMVFAAPYKIQLEMLYNSGLCLARLMFLEDQLVEYSTIYDKYVTYEPQDYIWLQHTRRRHKSQFFSIIEAFAGQSLWTSKMPTVVFDQYNVELTPGLMSMNCKTGNTTVFCTLPDMP